MEELLKQILAELVKLNAFFSSRGVVAPPPGAGLRPQGMRPGMGGGIPPGMAEMMRKRREARGGGDAGTGSVPEGGKAPGK